MQLQHYHSFLVVRTLAVLAMLSACSAKVWADKGDKPPALLLDIAKAWENVSTRTGRMGIADEFGVNSNGVLVFRTEGKELLRSVPAFRLSPRKLSKLPVPEQLFGLNLQCSPAMDAQLKEVARFKTLAALKLYATPVTDRGVKELVDLKYLTMLDLGRTRVTDAGLKELTRLKNLTVLGLEHTRVTDAGLKELARLKNLTTLDLRHTKVTAAGLRELAGLKNLTIYLTHKETTEVVLKE